MVKNQPRLLLHLPISLISHTDSLSLFKVSVLFSSAAIAPPARGLDQIFVSTNRLLPRPPSSPRQSPLWTTPLSTHQASNLEEWTLDGGFNRAKNRAVLCCTALNNRTTAPRPVHVWGVCFVCEIPWWFPVRWATNRTRTMRGWDPPRASLSSNCGNGEWPSRLSYLWEDLCCV